MAYWYRLPLGTEQVVSSIPGSVGYIYPMFIEPTITRVPSGFSGYIWLDTKIVFKKKEPSLQLLNCYIIRAVNWSAWRRPARLPSCKNPVKIPGQCCPSCPWHSPRPPASGWSFRWTFMHLNTCIYFLLWNDSTLFDQYSAHLVKCCRIVLFVMFYTANDSIFKLTTSSNRM